MKCLHSYGLPVPEVYGYSPASDNAAKTEYLYGIYERYESQRCMAGAGGSDIVSIWRGPQPGEGGREGGHPAQGRVFLRWSRHETAYVVRQEITARRRPEIVRKRRGSARSSSQKELAYLEQFGQPLLLFRREGRDGYQYQEQSPSAHIENLKRYPSSHRHLSLGPLPSSNIVVWRSPDSGWQAVSLLDWQHASSVPLFPLAGVPQLLQNHDDPVSQAMTPP
ncbi:hypothetical protein NEOLEDRAFT_1181696 [Neolentinus lepideus HHB14362 ss-1]|uniref:Aminoglycoside phosphotransferase domain-containing protein n=1 Tax=Neolentinus lepideus HHB14362 ss-1 TaxID=1314782 RepID=A0A165PV13_9AGAM|nr:hypothetical protein NEOLEDRAFT_1181696 [Neolentinus lepideus HHB14362 ss-1]